MTSYIAGMVSTPAKNRRRKASDLNSVDSCSLYGQFQLAVLLALLRRCATTTSVLILTHYEGREWGANCSLHSIATRDNPLKNTVPRAIVPAETFRSTIILAALTSEECNDGYFYYHRFMMRASAPTDPASSLD